MKRKYPQNNRTWYEQDSSWKAEQVVWMIKKNNLNPATVGEAGCGAGEILHGLSDLMDYGIKFYGYEISPPTFDQCKRKSKKNLEFFSRDMTLGREKFDLVMANDVFEKVEDYLGFLRKIKEKGEYKIFHIPLDLSVQAVWRIIPLKIARRSFGHIHTFTKETALAALEDTGYKILDCFYTDGALELPNHDWKRNLLNACRRLFFPINSDLTVRILGGFSLLVLAE